MGKGKANTRAGARPQAARREGRAPAAATAKAETGAAPALGEPAPTKQAAVIGCCSARAAQRLRTSSTRRLARSHHPGSADALRQAGHVIDKAKARGGGPRPYIF